MSARHVDVLEIVLRYAAGYFPLYDDDGMFYWERLPVRAVLPLNEHAAARARRLARRGTRRFDIRRTTAVDDIIAQLRREEVKQRTWVKEEVAAIYRALHRVGLLQTVEAWDRASGRLVGALLGIALPGTFVAETMYGLVPEASKICLCQLVQDCHAQGYALIDVQTPHDLDEEGLPRAGGKTAHPCVRLGERRLTLARFRRAFEAAWQRSFDGDAEAWLMKMQARAPKV
jgi:leucyl/phenylalanyl-tRNA--protein transferase